MVRAVRVNCDVTKPSGAFGVIFRLLWAVLLCVISLRPSSSGTLHDGGSYLYAQYGRTLHARGRASPAEARKSAEPVRRWRYLHRVMRTYLQVGTRVRNANSKCSSISSPSSTRRDIRDRFELANTRELGTSPVVDFPCTRSWETARCIHNAHGASHHSWPITG
jgi:hypothetical protein